MANAVRGHARTLALLTPELRRRGVEAIRLALEELMAELERRFPGSREQSLFASVELSLRRLSETNRQRTRVLGVSRQGGRAPTHRPVSSQRHSRCTSLPPASAPSSKSSS